MRIYPLANSVLNEGTSVPRCQNKERGREESREQVKLTYNFMGIHSRCSSGLSNSSLATSRVYSAWNPRERERERDGKKKQSISHWLWRLTAVRRGSHSYCARVIIIVTHGKGSNELAHSFRIPFSHPGNLINRERKIIILYSFDGAIVPDSTDPWDVCLPGRFDGIISRKKERKKKRKKKNGTLISTSLRRLQAPAPQVVP